MIAAPACKSPLHRHGTGMSFSSGDPCGWHHHANNILGECLVRQCAITKLAAVIAPPALNLSTGKQQAYV
jgi:hypothetical protein